MGVWVDTSGVGVGATARRRPPPAAHCVCSQETVCLFDREIYYCLLFFCKMTISGGEKAVLRPRTSHRTWQPGWQSGYLTTRPTMHGLRMGSQDLVPGPVWTTKIWIKMGLNPRILGPRAPIRSKMSLRIHSDRSRGTKQPRQLKKTRNSGFSEFGFLEIGNSGFWK